VTAAVNWASNACDGLRLAYFDAYRTERFPRTFFKPSADYSARHTYERVDNRAASSSTQTGPATAEPRPHQHTLV